MAGFRGKRGRREVLEEGRGRRERVYSGWKEDEKGFGEGESLERGDRGKGTGENRRRKIYSGTYREGRGRRRRKGGLEREK